VKISINIAVLLYLNIMNVRNLRTLRSEAQNRSEGSPKQMAEVV